MFIISCDVFVRKNDSCIMINSLVTSFTSESGLSCVILTCYSLYFDEMALLGLILLPTV